MTQLLRDMPTTVVQLPLPSSNSATPSSSSTSSTAPAMGDDESSLFADLPALLPAPSESLSIVTPGDRIGSTATHSAGAGTYVLGTTILASVVGALAEETTAEGQRILTVVRERPLSPAPKVGDVVLGRITKMNTRMAHMDILSVNGAVLSIAAVGVIR